MVLKNVFYALGMRKNLIFVSSLTKRGLEVHFYNKRVSIENDKKVFVIRTFDPKYDLFHINVIKNEMNELNMISNYSLCLLSEIDL
jgi:hypothetical protein